MNPLIVVDDFSVEIGPPDRGSLGISPQMLRSSVLNKVTIHLRANDEGVEKIREEMKGLGWM